jgi:hypothetical protein
LHEARACWRVGEQGVGHEKQHPLVSLRRTASPPPTTTTPTSMERRYSASYCARSAITGGRS